MPCMNRVSGHSDTARRLSVRRSCGKSTTAAHQRHSNGLMADSSQRKFTRVLMRVSRAVGVLVIGVSVWGSGSTAEQRPDPVADMRQYVERFTGSEPRECGRHLLVQVD